VPAAIPIENRANLAPDVFSRLAVPLSKQHSIKNAIDWLAGHQPPLTLTDIIAQDEFSHDILVEYPGGLWLAYDTS
jgi:hypothetical protein